jgi:hypothetical protein
LSLDAASGFSFTGERVNRMVRNLKMPFMGNRSAPNSPVTPTLSSQSLSAHNSGSIHSSSGVSPKSSGIHEKLIDNRASSEDEEMKASTQANTLANAAQTYGTPQRHRNEGSMVSMMVPRESMGMNSSFQEKLSFDIDGEGSKNPLHDTR